jgi:hypothetical protein
MQDKWKQTGQVSTITKPSLKPETGSCYQTQDIFNDRESFPIFDPAEEALFKKVTFSTDSLDGPCWKQDGAPRANT